MEALFSIACPGARTVCLAIFFDDWSAPAQRGRPFPPVARAQRGPPLIRALVRLSKATPPLWQGLISLRPGWCEYLFLVDGEWTPDPNAPERCPDSTGDFSSARWIEPAVRPQIIVPASPSLGAAARRGKDAARRPAA